MVKKLTTGSEWLWTDTVDPGVSETNVSVGNLWLNTSSNDLFVCKDSLIGAQVWDKYPSTAVSVSNGGTGNSSMTDNGLLIGNGTDPITVTGAGTTGTVVIGTTGSDPSFSDTPTLTSITFGAGDALDSYVEQQTWTPTIIGGTIAGVGTYALQSGYYTRIGNMIFAQCHVEWTAHTGTGNMILDGFPFAARNSSDYDPEVLINPENIPLPGGSTSAAGHFQVGTTNVDLFVLRTNNTNDPIQMNVSGHIHSTATYLT